jgi:diketogulonate reductase-like aldo/keto reductase
MLLYGTAWKEDRTSALTTLAIRSGFRGFDTANQKRHYNELGCGEAIAAAVASGAVTRGELFLQSKFTHSRGHAPGQEPYDTSASIREQVVQSFESSLGHFGTDYLDSYILHGPLAHGQALSAADLEVWRALEELYAQGRVRAIGVSNMGRAQLEALLASAKVPPHVVQIRTFAESGWDDRVGGVRALCDERNIAFEAFSVLTANRRALSHASFLALAKLRGDTQEQLAFRFALSEGMVVLTGTTDTAHMTQDLAVVEELNAPGKALSQEDLAVIRNVVRRGGPRGPR